MNDLVPFLTVETMALIIKGVTLLLIGLYVIFVFIIYTHIRSLKRIIMISHSSGSPLIQTLSLIYLLVAIFLFVAGIVIL